MIVVLASSSDRLRKRVQIININSCVKKMICNEFLDFSVKNVITADQAQVLHDSLREITDHTSVIGNGIDSRMVV